jgi:hypothetical protein
MNLIFEISLCLSGLLAGRLLARLAISSIKEGE